MKHLREKSQVNTQVNKQVLTTRVSIDNEDFHSDSKQTCANFSVSIMLIYKAKIIPA